MSKKRNKKKGSNKYNKYNNPHYTYYAKKVTSQDINTVAYAVFGSLYYNPVDN